MFKTKPDIAIHWLLMPTQSKLSLTASAANLRRLAIIRLIFISVLLSAMAYTYISGQQGLVLPAHVLMLAALSLLTVATYWRLLKPWPVTDIEYFFQLLMDIAGLTGLLYFSGGATNPLVSYYLVPLTVSAAILPWRFTWIIAGLSLALYSIMLFFYHPLNIFQPQDDHLQHGGFNLHILGMWFTFALSTGLITYFVVKMANALRHQENLQVANRENELLDEQVLAVATLAAGTAHELGTPLSTMTVLLDELVQENHQQDDLSEDLQILKNQVDNCRKILKGLVTTAEAHSHGQMDRVLIGNYVRELVDRWQVLRPDVTFTLTVEPSCDTCALNVDPTLEQAINNLLNNAADACADNINIHATVNSDIFSLSIRDYGPGIPIGLSEELGKPFITTKGKGLGLGLFLSHATINRYQGTIKLTNHPQGGSMAEITLPLATALGSPASLSTARPPSTITLDNQQLANND